MNIIIIILKLKITVVKNVSAIVKECRFISADVKKNFVMVKLSSKNIINIFVFMIFLISKMREQRKIKIEKERGKMENKT